MHPVATVVDAVQQIDAVQDPVTPISLIDL